MACQVEKDKVASLESSAAPDLKKKTNMKYLLKVAKLYTSGYHQKVFTKPELFYRDNSVLIRPDYPEMSSLEDIKKHYKGFFHEISEITREKFSNLKSEGDEIKWEVEGMFTINGFKIRCHQELRIRDSGYDCHVIRDALSYLAPIVENQVDFKYVICEGFQRKYPSGYICFQDNLEGQKVLVTLMDVENIDIAKDQLEFSLECKCEFVLETFILDSKSYQIPRLLVSKIIDDWESFVEGRYTEYECLLKTGAPDMWPFFLLKESKSIFRSVLLGLRFLYSKKKTCHGNLSKGIYIIKGHKAKLWNIRKNQTSFEDGVLQDLKDLKSLVIQAFSKHDGMSIPKEIWCFVNTLEDIIVSGRCDFVKIDWCLDDSSFWTDCEKINFIEKMWDLMRNKNHINRKDLNFHFKWTKLGGWQQRIITTGGQFVRVLNQFMGLRQEVVATGGKLASGQLNNPYSDDASIINFSRNALMYYFESTVSQDNREYILRELEQCIPEMCSEIRFGTKLYLENLSTTAKETYDYVINELLSNINY